MGALIGLILMVGLGFWYYSERQDAGGMTAKQYYEACWELRAKTVNFKVPMPSNPYQAAQWKNCEIVAKRAIFGRGLILAGREEGADYDQLRRFCPNFWSEVPLGGLYYLYVKDTEDAGGVSAFLSWLPATLAVGIWASARWPQCSDERERQGISRIVETVGKFGWEKPCSKCK